MNDRGRLIYALFLLVPFAVQLAVLFFTGKRFRPLRFAIPVLAAAAGAAFFLACILTAPPGWGLILWPLAAIICLLLSSLTLMGWGLAWLVYYLINLTKRKASDTP